MERRLAAIMATDVVGYLGASPERIEMSPQMSGFSSYAEINAERQAIQLVELVTT